jgi:GTP diphosphokinase / guanosine-3',5'-bis(diphosphate) 3'-diphosphatase
MNGLGLVLKALHFAADKHRFQRRKDQHASPYINHPIDLANLLTNEAHITDTVLLAAAILHDTVEDTETTFEELDEAFGPEVTAIVAEVTDDTSLPKAERKRLQIEHAPNVSFRAQQLKFADKICNLRDIARSPPAEWTLERRRDYFEWAKRVVDGMRGPHVRLAELFDAAYGAKP